MNLNQRVKDVVAGALTATLVVGMVPAAFATVGQVNLKADYNNIKVVVDGKELATDKEPFAVEGTTYLPVRAVAEAVGKDVTWDSKTQTVYLVSKPNSAENQTNNATYSRKNPAPIGVAQAISSTGIAGEYNAKVTVLSSERGESAWTKIKASNKYNEKAPDGKEYVLVKVKIAVDNIKNDGAVRLNSRMFEAFTANDEQYEKIHVTGPDPTLSGDIYSGSSAEGYIVFLVDKDDKGAKISFGRKYDGTGGIWFKI